MKLARYFKSAIAGLTVAAMAVTMLPVNGLCSVQAAASTDGSMVMHWDMTMNDDGTVKDLTGNSHSGAIVDAVESAEIDGVDVLNLKGGYVKIPDGAISSDMTAVTINMLVKVTTNVQSSWMWALGSSNKRYMYITGCSNQNRALRGGVGFVPDSGGNGWDYESVIGGDKALDEGVWQNITATYSDATKDFTFYLNGQKQNSINMEDGNAKNTTLQGLMTSGDGMDGYMGWSLYPNDPKFKGSVADFRIYNKALSDGEVTELQADIEEMLDSLSSSDFTAKDINLAETDCLGTNVSKDEIKADLVLPTKTTIGNKNREGNITKWVSSNPSVISAEGKVTVPLLDTAVTMTATVERNGISANKALAFTVLGNATDESLAQMDADSLNIPNMNDIRGNISLPNLGANGSKITWKSSDESVIKTTASGSILPGVVSRQPQDTKVTLTAKLENNSAVIEKKFECTVKKAIEKPVTTDYIFAYFPYTNIKQDERIYFGISEDGLNFTALNNGQFVLESKLGTHGLRDPFIIRSPEGDRFYLIATDLTVAGIEQDGVKYPGQGWNENQENGSQKIMVWESTDLVNWSDQRECKVARHDAGCTWAPEAYWDDETGQYVVFWASKTGDDGYGKQRLYYATTRDFYNFSEAQVWIEQSGSVIDTTVIKVGDYYYRYTKNEAGETVNGTPSKRIFCERSRSLTSKSWELVHENSLDVSGGQIEGGCIFKINDEDVENAKKIAALKGFSLTGNEVYCLAADATGKTIFPGLSDDITTGSFHVLGTDKAASVNGTTLYSMPEPDASHGTIMPITAEEYNNLRLKWDASYAAAAKDFVDKADAAAEELTIDTSNPLAADITLPSQTSNGASVTWASSNEAVLTSDGKVTRPSNAEGDAVVELTATITVAGNATVRDQVRHKTFQVTVAKKEAAYYAVKFDSKGGSSVKAVSVAEGDKVARPANPTRSGYSFEGWYLGNVKYDFNKAVTSNITLTARWKATTVTVKFDSNGGSKVSSKKVQPGKTVSKPKTTRAKYTFLGWYKGSKKFNFKTKVTSNITLKAKWKKVTVATSAVKSAKNKKSKKCEVIVKKVSGAKGYQLTYATDSKFKKNKKNVSVKTTGKAVLTKLKKGQKYYIKVRAYKVDSKGAKVYGKYSKTKSVTIRK